MKLLYINDELVTSDGSNSHAVGLLCSLKEILGVENVESFPQAEDGSRKPTNIKTGRLKAKFKGTLQIVRYFRKKYLSIKRSEKIIADLKNKGFVPTHVMARSTAFDTTAVYVAKSFGAKLIYEFNTPEFYERGVIKEEPLTGAIETWEKGIIDVSDYIYINSNICRDMICEHYHLNKNKFLVIPNGYMGELYTENEVQRQEIRESVRFIEKISDKFVVTFVGSLKVWHGIRTFCEIAKNLENDDSIQFLVLGDGEMHDMIADYVQKHKNMIFKGKVDLETMKNYLYASDLGIMPYENKDYFYYSPLKMFDMIGAGVPFIGTRVGQVEEFCMAYLNEKFLCNDSHMNSYISSLRNAISNIDEMNELVKKIRSNVTWKKRADELITCIER